MGLGRAPLMLVLIFKGLLSGHPFAEGPVLPARNLLPASNFEPPARNWVPASN